jgi:hypothetical protein
MHDLKPILTEVRVVEMINFLLLFFNTPDRKRIVTVRRHCTTYTGRKCHTAPDSELVSSPALSWNRYAKNNVFGSPSSRSNPRPYQYRGVSGHNNSLHFWCHDCKNHTNTHFLNHYRRTKLQRQTVSGEVQYVVREMRCRMGRKDMLCTVGRLRLERHTYQSVTTLHHLL